MRNDGQILSCFQLKDAARRGAAASCEKCEEDVETSYSNRDHMKTGWSWGY
jgi:hypothetical protein